MLKNDGSVLLLFRADCAILQCRTPHDFKWAQAASIFNLGQSFHTVYMSERQMWKRVCYCYYLSMETLTLEKPEV
jgi:hypothetical protein